MATLDLTYSVYVYLLRPVVFRAIKVDELVKFQLVAPIASHDLPISSDDAVEESAPDDLNADGADHVNFVVHQFRAEGFVAVEY